jgi:hypothetical protein
MGDPRLRSGVQRVTRDSLRRLLVRVLLVVLGLAGAAHAQAIGSGPQFCPPLGLYQTPTLADVSLGTV